MFLKSLRRVACTYSTSPSSASSSSHDAPVLNRGPCLSIVLHEVVHGGNISIRKVLLPALHTQTPQSKQFPLEFIKVVIREVITFPLSANQVLLGLGGPDSFAFLIIAFMFAWWFLFSSLFNSLPNAARKRSLEGSACDCLGWMVAIVTRIRIGRGRLEKWRQWLKVIENTEVRILKQVQIVDFVRDSVKRCNGLKVNWVLILFRISSTELKWETNQASAYSCNNLAFLCLPFLASGGWMPIIGPYCWLRWYYSWK